MVRTSARRESGRSGGGRQDAALGRPAVSLIVSRAPGYQHRSAGRSGASSYRADRCDRRLVSPTAASGRLPIMADDLTESTVRQQLRDQSGELYCARCLARVLNLDPSATEAAVVALSERRPPFAAGLCGCGNPGLKYLLQ